MYLCKKEPRKKKIVKKINDACYLRDGRGDYVVDSRGEKVRVGYCDKYIEEEVEVEKPKVCVKKYMVCHAKPGMQSSGTSLCLPRAEIEAYIKNARAEGGNSYMGPCK